jgi:hypothetical protein
MPLAAAGGLAGSDVGPGHGNKRHEVAIELTTVLLAVVARPGRAPAMAHDGDRRRRTRRLGAWRCGGQIDANECARELAWVLRKRAMGLDGGERERGALAPAAATMAVAMARAARCGARGEAEGLYTRLGRPVGDARVTAEMPAVTSWNFSRNVSNAKMWISKFRFEIECIIKI